MVFDPEVRLDSDEPWCRFITELLSTTGMLWSAGNQEPMNPAEEADLKKFVGDHTGDYDSTPCHSFLIVYNMYNLGLNFI